jgi:fructose-1,6-bisphosphatase/inositol monophosphatase family enzyme
MTDRRLERLIELQRRIRSALRARMAARSADVLSRSVRDGRGDTIFAVDVAAEDVLLPFCEEWGREECFVLIAEGLDERGVVFGRPGSSGPAFRVIADPIDGTRGLMYDKRSAWSLAALAADRGPETGLADLEQAVMTELPTTRQATSDVLWARRGHGVHGVRQHLLTAHPDEPLAVCPSTHDHLLHGFATVANYFQGGKEITARVDEALLRLERGGWNPEKAEIYTDQYISTGGALAELALGRDRFVMDIRPLVHAALGVTSSLCCKPYDLCTALIADEAGCVVRAPDGSPLQAPLDLTTNVAFVAHANPRLAARLQPLVERVLADEGLIPSSTGPG